MKIKSIKKNKIKKNKTKRNKNTKYGGTLSWKYVFDPRTNECYYHNKDTNETTWNIPVDQLNNINVADSKKYFPGNFDYATDPSTGKCYFYDNKNKKSTWKIKNTEINDPFKGNLKLVKNKNDKYNNYYFNERTGESIWQTDNFKYFKFPDNLEEIKEEYILKGYSDGEIVKIIIEQYGNSSVEDVVNNFYKINEFVKLDTIGINKEKARYASELLFYFSKEELNQLLPGSKFVKDIERASELKIRDLYYLDKNKNYEYNEYLPYNDSKYIAKPDLNQNFYAVYNVMSKTPITLPDFNISSNRRGNVVTDAFNRGLTTATRTMRNIFQAR